MTSTAITFKMAGFRDRDKQKFPLENLQSVVDLFRGQLIDCEEPDLTLLSLVLGTVENALTVNRSLSHELASGCSIEPIFPVLQLSTIEALYQSFVTLIKGSVDLTCYSSKYATRDFVKKVSDVVWVRLTRTYYKDKAHIQSLYSYLTGNKLDCFGVALAVVAACQVLGFNDVHLALSEDHAWLVFGENGSETAEVTWHGKGNEDKRGQPVGKGVVEKSWLYLNGHYVICSRRMEVASMISSINPAINATVDSMELGCLQQDLLWLLYDLGHLYRYPMAIGCLADLEEISPTPGRPSSVVLFTKAINSASVHYNNMHVYPYTYLGGYYYRKHCFKLALHNWAEAAQAISRYNYNREDEEVYKEFLEIANERIPHMVRTAAGEADGVIAGVKVGPPLLEDPACYALLLRFFDGICLWEEDSTTPVLHIGWAKNLVFALSKFSCAARKRANVTSEDDEDDDDDDEPKEEPSDSEDLENIEPRSVNKQKLVGRPRKIAAVRLAHSVDSNGNGTTVDRNVAIQEVTTPAAVVDMSKEDDIKHTIEELTSKVCTTTAASSTESSRNDSPNLSMVALAHACGESILNPAYLLGIGEPFAATVATTPAEPQINGASPAVFSRPVPTVVEVLECPQVVLHSEKMKGLRGLLLAEKLNASAIKLQLTAQSQVHLKHTGTHECPAKRTRR